MNRSLSEIEIETLINLGKTVEAFLGRINEDKEIVSWIDLRKTKKGRVKLTYHEVYDEGSLEWLDLYAFTLVDPDMDVETYKFDSVQDALKFIKEKYNVHEPKFLNSGVIQDEYKKLLISEGRE